jgi:hypothetical protein
MLSRMARHFWRCSGGQERADLLHQGDVRQAHVDLFAGDALQQLLRFGEIHLVSLRELPEINSHDANIRPEPDGLLGVIAEQRPHLHPLVVSEFELLHQPFYVAAHHATRSHGARYERGWAKNSRERSAGGQRRRITASATCALSLAMSTTGVARGIRLPAHEVKHPLGQYGLRRLEGESPASLTR